MLYHTIQPFFDFEVYRSPCKQCFGSGCFRGFLPIWIRVLKVGMWIRLLINLRDLNDGYDKVLEEPNQGGQCKSAIMKYNIFFYFNSSFRTFFHRSGFFRIGSEFLADPDPESEKKSDPDPGKKTRIRNVRCYETLVWREAPPHPPWA